MEYFYRNCVLRIDLDARTATTEPLREPWLSRYIGGKGLFLRYLWEELPPRCDALSPRSPLILATGPFAGTSVATCSRLLVGFKSPKTGLYSDCYVGGSFGSELKFAGYDLVIIQGRAERPTVVSIVDDNVEFIPADDVWGARTAETEAWARRTVHQEARVLSIGPAGERLVPWACISTDRYHKAGRAGGGAVMGAKNLKAIVVRGTGGVRVPNPEAFVSDVVALHRDFLLIDAHMWAHTEGTPVLVDPINGAGALPTRNFSTGQFPGYERINSEAFMARRVGKRSCYQCVLSCRNLHSVDGMVCEGPEYETIAVCGANCGIDDISALTKFHLECDELGLDTISSGAVTALAMDLTERGIVDFGLRFGDAKAYVHVPQWIVNRHGPGAELVKGARELAAEYGVPELAFEAKNLEFPGYDPRGTFGMGLTYATSDRGACHMRAYPVRDEVLSGQLSPASFSKKAAYVIQDEDNSSLRWTGIFCDFWFPDASQIARLMRHVWQRRVDSEELRRVGERIWNLGRLLNIRENPDFEPDRLPPGVIGRRLAGGAASDNVITEDAFFEALHEYYALRGWTADGVPTESKLRELEIDVTP